MLGYEKKYLNIFFVKWRKKHKNSENMKKFLIFLDKSF